MKIVCIGRNYRDHAKELGNEVPTEPVMFMKPSTSLTIGNKPFALPEFSNDVHYELELVIRINRNGKYIEEQFASRYYHEIALGIDFTARDLQSKLKSKGLPWEKAKAFDGSAHVSEFVQLIDLKDAENIRFRLEKNGEVVQKGFSKDMLFNIDQLLVETSKYFKLMKGDMLFTGTPAGVGQVSTGDRLTGYLEDEALIDLRVK